MWHEYSMVWYHSKTYLSKRWREEKWINLRRNKRLWRMARRETVCAYLIFIPRCLKFIFNALSHCFYALERKNHSYKNYELSKKNFRRKKFWGKKYNNQSAKEFLWNSHYNEAFLAPFMAILVIIIILLSATSFQQKFLPFIHTRALSHISSLSGNLQTILFCLFSHLKNYNDNFQFCSSLT